MGAFRFAPCLNSYNCNHQQLPTTVVKNATFERMDNEGEYITLPNNDEFVFM